MQYHGSRYFDGYERAPSGKLVYTGPRYGFPTPEATRRMKGLTAILTIGMLAAEILAQFFPSAAECSGIWPFRASGHWCR